MSKVAGVFCIIFFIIAVVSFIMYKRIPDWVPSEDSTKLQINPNAKKILILVITSIGSLCLSFISLLIALIF